MRPHEVPVCTCSCAGRFRLYLTRGDGISSYRGGTASAPFCITGPPRGVWTGTNRLRTAERRWGKVFPHPIRPLVSVRSLVLIVILILAHCPCIRPKRRMQPRVNISLLAASETDSRRRDQIAIVADDALRRMPVPFFLSRSK
jgi:hypothetical protein